MPLIHAYVCFWHNKPGWAAFLHIVALLLLAVWIHGRNKTSDFSGDR